MVLFGLHTSRHFFLVSTYSLHFKYRFLLMDAAVAPERMHPPVEWWT